MSMPTTLMSANSISEIGDASMADFVDSDDNLMYSEWPADEAPMEADDVHREHSTSTFPERSHSVEIEMIDSLDHEMEDGMMEPDNERPIDMEDYVLSDAAVPAHTEDASAVPPVSVTESIGHAPPDNVYSEHTNAFGLTESSGHIAPTAEVSMVTMEENAVANVASGHVEEVISVATEPTTSDPVASTNTFVPVGHEASTGETLDPSAVPSIIITRESGAIIGTHITEEPADLATVEVGQDAESHAIQTLEPYQTSEQQDFSSEYVDKTSSIIPHGAVVEQVQQETDAAGHPVLNSEVPAEPTDTEHAPENPEHDSVSESKSHDLRETSISIYERPPVVLLSFSTPGYPECALFNSLADHTESPDAPPHELLLQSQSDLYYESLSYLFEALRKEPRVMSLPDIDNAELFLDAFDLELIVSEDNFSAQDASLYELTLIHDALNLEGPLRLRLSAKSTRFSTRFAFLRSKVAQLNISDRPEGAQPEHEGEHDADNTVHPEAQETTEPEGNPATTDADEADNPADDDAEADDYGHKNEHGHVDVHEEAETPQVAQHHSDSNEDEVQNEGTTEAEDREDHQDGEYEEDNGEASEDYGEQDVLDADAVHVADVIEGADANSGHVNVGAGDFDDGPEEGAEDAEADPAEIDNTEFGAPPDVTDEEQGPEHTEYEDVAGNYEDDDERYGEVLPEDAGGQQPVSNDPEDLAEGAYEHEHGGMGDDIVDVENTDANEGVDNEGTEDYDDDGTSHEYDDTVEGEQESRYLDSVTSEHTEDGEYEDDNEADDHAQNEFVEEAFGDEAQVDPSEEHQEEYPEDGAYEEEGNAETSGDPESTREHVDDSQETDNVDAEWEEYQEDEDAEGEYYDEEEEVHDGASVEVKAGEVEADTVSEQSSATLSSSGDMKHSKRTFDEVEEDDTDDQEVSPEKVTWNSPDSKRARTS